MQMFTARGLPAAAAALVFGLNPDQIYLSVTPMTEPVLSRRWGNREFLLLQRRENPWQTIFRSSTSLRFPSVSPGALRADHAPSHLRYLSTRFELTQIAAGAAAAGY